MILDMIELNKNLNKIINQQYYKMIFADLTTDEYQVFQAFDSIWNVIDKMLPTDKISEWFKMFSESQILHDDDRMYFKKFADINYFRSVFRDNGMKPVRISYQRKISSAESGYSHAMMEIFPNVQSNGHMMAYIFVKDITNSYESISKRIAENIKNEMLSKSYAEGRKTALVVEDNEINRGILCEIISGNYNVIEAENGQEGLDILRKRYQEISIILLDVEMPVMNGYEFMTEVSKSPALSSIPIIVLTTNDDSDVEEKCLNLRAADYLKKPYNPTIVLSRMASLIRLRESVTALLDIEFDELTGVYSKEAFMHHMGAIISQNPTVNYTLVVCDIEQFKFLGSAYGSEYADSLLIDVANTLREDYEPGVIIGRISEDIFAVFAPNEFKIVDEINLEERFSNVAGLKQANAVVKFGIYSNVNHMLPASEIFDRAKAALGYVKHQYNVNSARYDSSFEEMIHRQSVIEHSMNDALSGRQFVVYFQPKHVIITGELCGAEALIRWVHPQYGFMSPGEFIPIFERTGFVSEVDRLVWNEVCAWQKKWINQGLNAVPVSVNLSRIDFLSGDLVEFLDKSVKENDIPASLMHLEITESLFSEKMREIAQFLEQCKEIGFKIEMDDFGSGYSSLNVLGELPLDVVKLDMSFMKNLSDPRRARVLEACIMLAKSLKLQTICEGVETEEQISVIKSFGADCVQGYYYSKPLPAYMFEKYLKEHKTIE